MRYGITMHLLPTDEGDFREDRLKEMLGKEVEITDDFSEVKTGILREFKVLREGRACYAVIDISGELLHPSHEPSVDLSRASRPKIVRSQKRFTGQRSFTS